MIKLSTPHQIIVGLILVALIVLTRGHHFASLNQLPGASWAVFFLAGVYLRPAWILPALLVATWLMDFSSYILDGVGGFCLTPAYVFLLPAYSALWMAGRWYASQHNFHWRALLPLLFAILGGAVVCELFSSGGFYFFSGRFSEPNLAEFGARQVKYFPAYLQSLVFYAAIASFIHVLFVMMNRTRLNKNDISV